MAKPLIVPRIVIVGMFVMVFGATLAAAAYVFETRVLTSGDALPLFELFADAFKVGLGAFIGVLSQWASRVFAEAKEEQIERRAAIESGTPGSQEPVASPSPAAVALASPAQQVAE